MAVTLEYDRARQIVVFTAVGAITVPEVESAIGEAYACGPASRALWNLERADLSGLRVADLQALIGQAAHRAHGVFGGRCAIVVGSDDDGARVGSVEALAPPALLPFDVQVFRATDAAMAWLERAEEDAARVCCPHCRCQTLRRGVRLHGATLVTCHSCAGTFVIADDPPPARPPADAPDGRSPPRGKRRRGRRPTPAP